MAFVYVLRSKKNGKHYVGLTSRNPQIRLKEHNEGNTTWTRKNKPFDLIHEEEYESITEARKRERYLKSGSGREWLRRRLK